MTSKKKKQKNHFKRRALERYNLRLTDHDLVIISKNIQAGKYRFIDKQSNRISKFLVDYMDHQFIAVYDKLRHTVVTVLYPEKKDE